MALVVNDLKQAMMDSTYMLDVSAANSLTPLGNAIATYIVTNADLLFIWTDNAPATLPATGKIITCTITLTPSLAGIPINGLTWLATEIVAGIRLGTINITQGGWSTTPAIMSDCPDFTLTINGTSSREDAYNQITTQLITQITAYHPGLPVTGNRGSYSGATTLCTIS